MMKTARNWADDLGAGEGAYIGLCRDCGVAFMGRRDRAQRRACATTAGMPEWFADAMALICALIALGTPLVILALG